MLLAEAERQLGHSRRSVEISRQVLQVDRQAAAGALLSRTRLLDLSSETRAFESWSWSCVRCRRAEPLPGARRRVPRRRPRSTRPSPSSSRARAIAPRTRRPHPVGPSVSNKRLAGPGGPAAHGGGSAASSAAHARAAAAAGVLPRESGLVRLQQGQLAQAAAAFQEAL